jgi:hypothetical protein
MFELRLSQELDEGPGEIPDPVRIPLTVEAHSPACTYLHPTECPDRLEGWKLRHAKKMLWVVVWHNQAVACCLKRKWARELIAELKVRWVHES